MKLLLLLFFPIASYAQVDSVSHLQFRGYAVRLVDYGIGAHNIKKPVVAVQQALFDSLDVHDKRTVLRMVREWADAQEKQLPALKGKK